MLAQCKRHLLVVVFYLVLTVVMTIPVTLKLTTHVAGSGGDPWQTMWRFEQTWQALRHAVSTGELTTYLTTEILGGGSARLINLSVWPWLWLHASVGQPLAYNLIWLTSFVLAGYTMYLLALYLLQHHIKPETDHDQPITPPSIQAAALLAGVCYMFLPYHVAHAAGHFGAMQIQWLPLAILVYLRWLKQPTLVHTVSLAVVLIIQAWTEHHYALWFLLATLLIGIASWRSVYANFSQRRTLVQTGILIGLLVVGVIIPYSPTVRLAGESGALELGQEQTIRYSADPFAYVVPASFHPLWGSVSETLFSRHFTGNVAEATQYLGLIPLLLIIFFHQRIPRQALWLWLWIGGAFFVLSLGPRLHLNGHVTAIPLPYALIDSWPVFDAIRAIARAGVMVGLAVAVLITYVVATQIRRPVVIILLATLLLIEYMFLPVPVQSSQLSPVYTALAALPGQRVIEIPAATNYNTASRALYASQIHGKEVVGNIALERNGTTSTYDVRSLPAVRQLLYVRADHLEQLRPDFLQQTMPETLPDVLRLLDVSSVIVHHDSLNSLQTSAIRTVLEEQLSWTPIEYGDATLYHVPPAAQGDGIFVSRDSAWQYVGLDEQQDDHVARIANEASLTIYNITTKPQQVVLRYELEAGSSSDFTLTTDMHQSLLHTSTQMRIEVPPGQLTLRIHNNASEPIMFENPTVHVESR